MTSNKIFQGMTESKTLIAALSAMLILSFLTAGLLFWLGAGPLWVILGGTLCGAAAYVLLLVLSKPLIQKNDSAEEEQNA